MPRLLRSRRRSTRSLRETRMPAVARDALLRILADMIEARGGPPMHRWPLLQSDFGPYRVVLGSDDDQPPIAVLLYTGVLAPKTLHAINDLDKAGVVVGHVRVARSATEATKLYRDEVLGFDRLA